MINFLLGHERVKLRYGCLVLVCYNHVVEFNWRTYGKAFKEL